MPFPLSFLYLTGFTPTKGGTKSMTIFPYSCPEFLLQKNMFYWEREFWQLMFRGSKDGVIECVAAREMFKAEMF